MLYAHFTTDRRLADIRDNFSCVFLHSETLVPKHTNRFRRLKSCARWVELRGWNFLRSPVCPEQRSSRAQTRPIRTPGTDWAARLFCGLLPPGFLCRMGCTWTRDSRCRTCRFRPTWFGNDQRWAEVPAHTSSWEPYGCVLTDNSHICQSKTCLTSLWYPLFGRVWPMLCWTSYFCCKDNTL